MALNDRGNKKWTGLMLPEHVAALKQVLAEDDYKEMPILDEQQKIENNLLLSRALKSDLTVEIKYYTDHDYHVIQTNILFIDVVGGRLRLDNMDELAFENIIEVAIM